MEIVLVGELNPYGIDPRYALFDLPVRASGHRLRTRILQVGRRTYFKFKKHNLCTGKWSKHDARAEASRLYLDEYGEVESTFVLLGRKVAEAFFLQDQESFSWLPEKRMVLLPHPSGLCREWGKPGAYSRAREVLRAALPDVAWGEVAP